MVMPESCQFAVVKIIAPAMHAQNNSLGSSSEPIPESSRAIADQGRDGRSFRIDAEIQGLVLKIRPEGIFDPLPRPS